MPITKDLEEVRPGAVQLGALSLTGAAWQLCTTTKSYSSVQPRALKLTDLTQ